MADKNEIEFKVRVTDEGLAPLATRLDTVDQKTEELGRTASTTGKQLDALGGSDGLEPLASQLDKVDQKTDELGKSAATTGRQLDGMSDVGGLAPLASQLDKVDQKTDELGKSAATTGRQLDGMGGQLTGIKNQVLAIAGLDLGAGLVNDLAATADEFKNLEGRIRLVVGANGDVAGTMAQVKEVAQATYTSLDGTTRLFTRLAASAKELGLTQQDALGITQTINQAIQVSGASAAASDAAVQQLVQGLQSGVLRGDEFNSVMEQAPRLAKALADGLGVPVGALRGLAEQGKLTSAEVVRALQGQRAAIEGEFTQLPLTVGRAVQNLRTEFTSFVGLLDGTTGASSLAAEGIQALASHLDVLARVAGAAGAAMTAALAVQGVAALRAMSGSAALLTADLAKIPRIINITVAAVGFEVGFQIGEWLNQNSELARKLGVGVTEFLTNLVSDMQFLAEAASAVFTDDTVGAAFERYKVRAKEMQGTFAGMYEDAKNAPAPITTAATQATDGVTKMGAAAQVAGKKVADAGVSGAAGLEQIKPAADQAAGALAQLQEAAKAKPESVSSGIQLGLDLKKAHEEGRDLSAFLETKLPAAVAKLSGPELEKFKTDFQVAMQVAGGEGKALETGLRIIGERAAQSLGVDLVAAGTRVGGAFKASQDNLDTLIAALPALKATGVDVGQAVGKALEGMVDSVKNNAEVDALRLRIESLRKQLGNKVADGLLDQLRKQAEEAGLALDKLPKKVEDIATRTANAFKAMGIQTQAELSKAADEAYKNFELIRSSGMATADGLSDAWKQMAEASIAANGGVASETLKAESAMYGLEIQVDSTGKAIVSAMRDASDSVSNFQQQVDDAVRSAKELEALQKGEGLRGENYIRERNKRVGSKESAAAERKRLNVDEDGFSLDKSGNRLTMGGDLTTLTGIKNFLEQAGLSEEQARKVAMEFSDGKGNIPYFSNPGQIKYGGRSSTISEALLKAAERTTFGGAGVGGSGSKVGSSGSATGSTSHTVTINLGTRSTTINTASANDADALKQFLVGMQDAAGRS